MSVASPTYLALEMDNNVPPFDNILVRKAMQLASDREAINQAALLGPGVTARDHVVPPNDPRFAPQYAPPDYDPVAAKALLAEAGFPDGIGITLHTADIGQGSIEMAVAYQQSAAPAGIRVEVHRDSPDGFWDVVWNVEPFTIVYWIGRANPDQGMKEAYHSESVWDAPHYINTALDDLVVKARGQDAHGQKETYAEVQRILIDDVPRLVMAWTPLLYGIRNDVRDADPHPLSWSIFNEAWLDNLG